MSVLAPPALGRRGVALVTADVVEARGQNHGRTYGYPGIHAVERGPRDDGIAIVPPKMIQAAASKVGAGLAARELGSKPGKRSGGLRSVPKPEGAWQAPTEADGGRQSRCALGRA